VDGAGEAVGFAVVVPTDENAADRIEANMTRRQVTELMRNSRSQEEWDTNYRTVIAALGYRPPYWNLDIIESGVMERSMRTWPTNSMDLFDC
jgi:hypothetical protein